MFSGTETTSLELTAVLDAAAAETIERTLPDPLLLERDAERRGVASVLALEMHGLGLRGVPIGLDYREVLHRVAARFRGEPAWVALRCDLDRALVRAMAAKIIRYPVAAARIAIEDGEDGVVRLRSDGGDGVIAATFAPAEAVEPTPPRRTFVVHRERLFEIPWDERPAPVRRRASVTDSDASGCATVFGASLTFDGVATLHRGRTHFCGPGRAPSPRRTRRS